MNEVFYWRSSYNQLLEENRTLIENSKKLQVENQILRSENIDLAAKNEILEKKYQQHLESHHSIINQISIQLKYRKLKLIINQIVENLLIVEEDSQITLPKEQLPEESPKPTFTRNEIKKIKKIQKVVHENYIIRKWRMLVKNYQNSVDSKDFRRRAQIIKEIVQSEKTYNGVLKLVINEYMNPLYGGIVDIVTKSDIEAIFSNIFAIKELSDTLLESLESQFIRWPIYKLQFGETFEKLSPFFKCYTEYVMNYQKSLMILAKLKSKKPFSVWIDMIASKEEFHGLFLHDCLIMPIQRIPRYVLLLQELRKLTPEFHLESEGITKGLEKIKDIANNMNQKQKLAESMHRVYEIQNLLPDFSIMRPHRRLIKEGNLIEIDQKLGRCSRYGCLFNDLVITCSISTPKPLNTSPSIYALYSSLGTTKEESESWKLQTYLPLENGMVTELPEDGTIAPILISTPTHSLLLEYFTPDEKSEWLRDIGNVIVELMEKDLSYQKMREKNNKGLGLQRNSSFNFGNAKGSHEGYLYTKQYTHSSSWEMRWCVVADGLMHIYQELGEDDLKLICTLKLYLYNLRPIFGEFYGRLYCFELFSTPSDRYILSGQNQYDFDFWVTVITPYLSTYCQSKDDTNDSFEPFPSTIVTLLSSPKVNLKNNHAESCPNLAGNESDSNSNLATQTANSSSNNSISNLNVNNKTSVKSKDKKSNINTVISNLQSSSNYYQKILFGSIKTPFVMSDQDG